jgi:uncharacterized surface protein with fasciclin (FAS1) repeats
MTNILNTIYNTKELSTFSTALKITNIDKILADNCDFTIFAPDNLAFAELTKVNLKLFTTETRQLIEILSLHIIPGKFNYQSLLKMCKPGQQKTLLTALDSSQVEVNLIDGIRLNNSNVLSTDKSATNGILYLIDRVMLPVN